MIWGPGQSLALFAKSCISVVLRPLQKLGMSKRSEYTGEYGGGIDSPPEPCSLIAYLFCIQSRFGKCLHRKCKNDWLVGWLSTPYSVWTHVGGDNFKQARSCYGVMYGVIRSFSVCLHNSEFIKSCEIKSNIVLRTPSCRETRMIGMNTP